MPEKQSTCFDASHLLRFLHEQLSESDESTVIEHLDECPNCQATLESVAADGVLWSDLQNQLSDSTQPGFAGNLNQQERVSSHRDQIVESVMEFLGPTDDPNMMGRLGSYEVSGVVGRGSTGIVLKAFETRLNRFVAIKVLAPNFASNGSARARFEREAKAVAAVAHEHVVPIFAVNEHKNLPYLVMQYAGGGSLQQRIDENGPLDACEVARIGMQVASGLAAAHGQGIVHRDVKPANVMLEGGVERAMVTDFGLARVVDEASMTRSGAITGTPQFMSPEQARGEYIDHRSDLFSLGSLMYTATTGRPPFRSETVYGVIRRVCETDIRPVREINPTIPDWLEAFIAKLCSKNREDRFQSGDEVRDILARELAHMQSPQTQAPERSWLPNPITEKNLHENKPRRQLAIFGTIATILCIGVLLIPSVQNALGKSWNFAATFNKRDSHSQPPPASFVWNADQLPVFESAITRALPVDTGGRVKLLAGNADVQILPSHSQQLEVRVVRKVAALDRQQAKTCFPLHRLQFTPDANGWIVKSTTDADKMAQRFGPFSIRIYVPDGYGVDIPTPNDDVSTSVTGGELKPIRDGAVAFAYSRKDHWTTATGKTNYQDPRKEGDQ